jgi:hypothetical protein
MHINITYIVIVLMPQHVSVIYHHLQGVAASFVLKIKHGEDGDIAPKHAGELTL